MQSILELFIFYCILFFVIYLASCYSLSSYNKETYVVQPWVLISLRTYVDEYVTVDDNDVPSIDDIHNQLKNIIQELNKKYYDLLESMRQHKLRVRKFTIVFEKGNKLLLDHLSDINAGKTTDPGEILSTYKTLFDLCIYIVDNQTFRITSMNSDRKHLPYVLGGNDISSYINMIDTIGNSTKPSPLINDNCKNCYLTNDFHIDHPLYKQCKMKNCYSDLREKQKIVVENKNYHIKFKENTVFIGQIFDTPKFVMFNDSESFDEQISDILINIVLPTDDIIGISVNKNETMYMFARKSRGELYPSYEKITEDYLSENTSFNSCIKEKKTVKNI